MECSGEVSARVCSACSCAWRVCNVGGCNVVANEHSRYSLSCMQKL